MRYTVKIKGEAEPLKVDADDVDLERSELESQRELDYNFLNAEEQSVARIPFDNVVYIARL
jgi:hypothetical protein